MMRKMMKDAGLAVQAHMRNGKRFGKTILYFLCLFIILSGLAGCAGETLSETYGTGSFSEKAGYLAGEDWLDSIPDYRGTPYIEVNHDVPFFSDDDKKNKEAFEIYSDLDELGRCGVAYANICEEIMPTEEREDSLRSVTPSGWCQKQYNGEYLLNRCHLIGYQLAGENANEKNLIAGTRYFNVDGMLPFENTVAEYIDEHPFNHVLYRVTPVYKGENDLMAYGVLMEAWSVEDNGYGCQFCVFVYNVQEGVEINYATGENQKAREKSSKRADAEENATYVLNTGNRKFHTEDCANGDRISGDNRSVYTGSREDLIAKGYEPAGCCNP